MKAALIEQGRTRGVVVVVLRDQTPFVRKHVAAKTGHVPVDGGPLLLHDYSQRRSVDLKHRCTRPRQENSPQNG